MRSSPTSVHYPAEQNSQVATDFRANVYHARKIISKVVVVLLLTLVTFLFIAPYLWMIFSSFKSTADIFRYSFPVTWKTFLPPDPTVANYVQVFVRWGFAQKLFNSLFVAVCQVIGTLAVCSLSAFIFARVRFRGKNLLFALVMLTAFVPFEITIIPLYMVVRELGLQNTYASLYLPWVASAFGIFLLRQAFVEIPKELEDAAMVEGASLFQIFRHVILPNARPTLITLALVNFLWSWNSFLWPLIVMQDAKKQVIQVGIATFTIPTELPAWGDIFAAASVATVPVLILFLVLQRYYIRGVVLSGMKG